MNSQESLLNLDDLFLDSVEMTVDQKGRVGIPEKFMKVIRRICPDHADVIGVAPAPGYSIMLMPYSLFARKVTKWGHLDGEVQAERTMLTFQTSLSNISQLDPQNRLKLNPELMELCKIEKEVVIAGNIHYMQLYAKSTFKQMMKDGFVKFDEAHKEATKKSSEPAPLQLVLNPIVQGPGNAK